MLLGGKPFRYRWHTKYLMCVWGKIFWSSINFTSCCCLFFDLLIWAVESSICCVSKAKLSLLIAYRHFKLWWPFWKMLSCTEKSFCEIIIGFDSCPSCDTILHCIRYFLKTLLITIKWKKKLTTIRDFQYTA